MDYESISGQKEFAVFSEVFYSGGWKAFIDGAETPIVRTDYVLRGLSVPAGKHQIRFVFHPAAYYTGQLIQNLAGIILVLLLAGAGFLEWRRRRGPPSVE
ncbi:MAG TPA: YfhO family protein [Puia sp.]|nr:YfhO family protein [Puia sp.]